MSDEESTEIALSHDDLLNQIGRQLGDERERKSDAGESGARLKNFIEDTGVNSQAFSWMKSTVKKLEKKKGASKAMDIIRSLEVMLPMVRDHVEGQQSDWIDQIPDAEEDEISQETEDFEEAVSDLDDPDFEDATDEDGNVVQAFAG